MHETAGNSLNVNLLSALIFFITLLSYPTMSVATDHMNAASVMDLHLVQSSTLSLPTDVAVSKGRIAIVDSGNHRVVVFGKGGKFLFVIGGKGRDEGLFLNPVGLDMTRNGKIYVADKDNNRIQIFSRSGKLIDSFHVVSDGVPVRPIDVAAGPRGNLIYVTGNNNHKVMVFNKRGQLIREWGGSGAENGEFNFPGTLTLLKDNKIAIVDVLNTRVQIFDREGEYQAQIGGMGVFPGRFFRPKGVAVDMQNRLYVSDSYMNVIQVFSDSGAFLLELKPGDSTSGFLTPAGIDFEDNRLYVAEYLRNKVSVLTVR